LRSQLESSIVVSTPTREDDAVVSHHPDRRPSLGARLRLALHDSRGRTLNPVVHHERERYFFTRALIIALVMSLRT
jgi:hypothetical protein